jgi:DNA-binding XRE family transcriptional regulator
MMELALLEENHELKRNLAQMQVQLNYAQACTETAALPTTKRYKLMQQLHEQQQLPLTQLSNVAGVSRQAYYQWQHRRPSANDELNAKLLTKIRLLEKANHN